MVSRRALFGIGLCGWPRLLKGRARPFEVGDLVRIVALPSDCRRQWKNREMNEHAALLRDCLGGLYRVVYIGEDGRPELDVTTTAIARNPRLVGCEISIEPECIALVA
jgi:hypothetical protein